jgi:hypothetical protein
MSKVRRMALAAAASGGRMTVQKQSFVQPPGPRNPEPVTVTNLVATLRGTSSSRPTASTWSAGTTTHAAPTS